MHACNVYNYIYVYIYIIQHDTKCDMCWDVFPSHNSSHHQEHGIPRDRVVSLTPTCVMASIPRPFKGCKPKKSSRIIRDRFWKQAKAATVLLCLGCLILFDSMGLLELCFFLQLSGLICWLVGSVGIPPPLCSWHWIHLGSIVGTTNLIYCSKIISCTFQFCPKFHIVESDIWNQIFLGTSNIIKRPSLRLSFSHLKTGPFAASVAFKLCFKLTSHDGSTIYWGNTQVLYPIHTSSILTYQILYPNHPKMRPLPEYICHGRENNPQFVIPAVM